MSKNIHNSNCVSVNKSAPVQEAMVAAGVDFPLQQTGTIRVPVVLGVYDITSHLTANIKFPHPLNNI
ncbi:hypothetical protein [Ornithinibacillus halotolerans]|uniref:Uncharacterized protein n=1 Tax=Ornithinibacillus halotolerans TaxID=1274357 RepID=A0A916S0T1_9BACI|nr:hypothetical protein [Ornithinibacillus halotolerans]GGA75870.1 hypothetical protein GCM10008025_19410 [Ornithinibacillus halotolerans]